MIAAVLVCAAFVFAAPSASAAYQDYYCGYVIDNNPTQLCNGHGLHSYDYNQGSYPGPLSHNVWICTYLRNQSNGAIRGGIVKCMHDVSNHYYGPTGVPQYTAHLYIDPVTCCPHTINGYASA